MIILKIFKDLFACKFTLAENHHYPGNIQRLFCLQNCLSRNSLLSWKYSKTFSTAKLSWPQIIKNLGNIQRLFRLQNGLSRKPSLSWKDSKIFLLAKLSYPQKIIILKLFKDLFACKIVLAANHQNLGNIQRLFRLQNCLSRKSSLTWNYSKTFSPGKLSSTQIMTILKRFEDFPPAELS